MLELKLTPDYCCGGGHCGPMPGYRYKCPHCDKSANCRTYYPLKVGDSLKCNICNGKIEAKNKIEEFKFEFELIKGDDDD